MKPHGVWGYQLMLADEVPANGLAKVSAMKVLRARLTVIKRLISASTCSRSLEVSLVSRLASSA